MTAKALDKENPNGITMAGGGKQFGANFQILSDFGSTSTAKVGVCGAGVGATSSLSTPKVKKLEPSGSAVTSALLSKQRRALGDVFNTASCNRQSHMTPLKEAAAKGLRCATSHTPAHKMAAPTATATNTKTNDETLCDIEHGYTGPADTFDDLFADSGRLSDVFANKNVCYLPRISAGVCMERLLEPAPPRLDNELTRKLLKKQKKAMRRDQAAHELCAFQEQPADLEMPDILKNF